MFRRVCSKEQRPLRKFSSGLLPCLLLLMNSFMYRQIGCTVKTLFADITLKWPHTSVYNSMSLETSKTTEAFIALIARKRPIRRVCTLMPFQGRALAKTSIAYITFKGTFS